MTAHGNFISFSDSSYLQMIIWCEDETPYGFSVVNFDGSADMSQARTLFIQAIVTVQSTPNKAPTALPRKAATMASKEETP